MASPTYRGSAGTIKWGTDNTANSLSNTVTAIIDSIGFDDQSELVEIEDNNGHPKILVSLERGWDATIKVVHDSGLTYPVKGGLLLVKHPRIDATNAVNCTVATISDEFSRKKEGMATLKVMYRPNVNVALTA